MKGFVVVGCALLSVAAQGQQIVPAIDPTAPVVGATVHNAEGDESALPLNLLSGKDIRLNATQRQAVALSKQWMAAPTPTAGENGAVVFTYGAALPTVICSPLHVCDIALEPGETINDIHIGDRVRWKIYPAVTGTGSDKRSHLIIKATDTALQTNLNVSTDRRTYVIELVSRKDDWMPLVSFAYPEDTEAQWEKYRQAQTKLTEATVLPTGENVATLDFSYSVKGDKVSWRPLRVYSNGSKTYIQFPAVVAQGNLPALVALGVHNAEQLVNYRMVGDRFEVDKLLTHAALIRGVGRRQERVEILYDGKR
jgi:type IV secretion system protein TrbG